MKIGIVSAQKHCKTHLRQLQKDGYEVYCLGADPNTIPPSYDALVVRTGSMAHNKVPRDWGKITGRPVIYEEGLTGIRRELKRLGGTPQSKILTAAISVQEVRDKMLEWGATLIEARPHDRRSDVSRHLSRTLRDQYPSMASDSKALVASVVGELFNAAAIAQGMAPIAAVPVQKTPVEVKVLPLPSPPAQPAAAHPAPTPRKAVKQAAVETEPPPSPPQQEADAPMPRKRTIQYPTQSVPWETVKADEKWCKKYTPDKLNKAYRQAVEIMFALTDEEQEDFASDFISKAEKGRGILRRLVRVLKPHVKGKPLAFVMFVYLVLPEDHEVTKGALYDCYLQITDKGSDTTLAYAVMWYLDRGIETKAMPEVNVLTLPSQSLPAQAGATLPALPTLLTRKEDLVESEAEFEGLPPGESPMAGVHEPLEAIEAIPLENALVPQAPDDDSVSENSRVLCELLDEVQMLKKQVADLQARPVATGTALAPADPFSVLDDIKDRLRALGFRGTLTLTID
jgi:cell division septation protein DedD